MTAMKCRTAKGEFGYRSWIAALFWTGMCLAILFSPPPASGFPQTKKLSVENIMDLLSGGVAVPRIRELVNERGVDFSVDARLEQTILDSGGDPNLVAALRQRSVPGGAQPLGRNLDAASSADVRPGSVIAPSETPSTTKVSPMAPEVARLQVRSQPGGVSIFLDGELQGTTDEEEGRLDVGVSNPGKHVVRATREGYQDVEATLNVAEGQVLDTPIWLSKAESMAEKAPAAPELPPGKKFLVRHVHRAIPGVSGGGYCQGWMIVNVGFVRYISTDSRHKYLMNTSEMKQAKGASGQGRFTIKLDFGREFQFVAVNEKGAAVSPGPVLAEIRYSMGE